MILSSISAEAEPLDFFVNSLFLVDGNMCYLLSCYIKNMMMFLSAGLANKDVLKVT